jgi:SAM-dependent methyltransferase
MHNCVHMDWLKDSQSFDSVADLYDEFRPAYPQEIVDRIIVYSNLPEHGRILEIGSGTGKATRLFAGRGYSIHCIEPGRNLARLAAGTLRDFPRVTFEIARFEQSKEPAGEFNLAISAQAFHWVSEEVGYGKVAQALKTHGTIALFWNMNPAFQGKIATELDNIYQSLVPELNGLHIDDEQVMQERIKTINQSGFFGPVTLERFPWSRTYQTREYLGLLNTYSDHLRLKEKARQNLFKAIAAAIDAQGGSITREYVTVLYLAHKLLETRRLPCADVSH